MEYASYFVLLSEDPSKLWAFFDQLNDGEGMFGILLILQSVRTVSVSNIVLAVGKHSKPDRFGYLDSAISHSGCISAEVSAYTEGLLGIQQLETSVASA